MKSFFLVAVAALFLFLPAEDALAQDPEIPVPLAVLKDADGKVMGAIADFGGIPSSADSTENPRVFFDFDGVPALVSVNPNTGEFGKFHKTYFTGASCTGNAYLDGTGKRNFENWSGIRVVILGPDPTNGTYRVFRTAGGGGDTVFVSSFDRANSTCEADSHETSSYSRVVEILPNPLEGFHGPTTANPERVLTIEGGTRLP